MKKGQVPPEARWQTLFILCLVLAFLLFIVLSMHIWGIRLFAKSIDYQRFGNWSEVISGVGTMAAVLVALFALVRERIMQTAAEKKTQLLAETAIYLWLVPKQVLADGNRFMIWDLIIQNGTPAPIYDWQVAFGSAKENDLSRRRPLLPGQNIFNLPQYDNHPESEVPEPTIEFRSASDQTWVRTVRGNLFRTENTFGELERAVKTAFLGDVR